VVEQKVWSYFAPSEPICKEIFAGKIDPANIELREDEYQQALDVLR
jgi:hypothetical protein